MLKIVILALIIYLVQTISNCELDLISNFKIKGKQLMKRINRLRMRKIKMSSSS